MRERLLIVEDNREHRLDLSEGFKEQGYDVEFTDKVSEAVMAARQGVRKFVVDAGLKGNDRFDHSGLRFIKPIIEANRAACIMLCSVSADLWGPDALELGAHGAIRKSADLRSTVLELENHFLRHNATAALIEFIGLWWIAPVLAGTVAGLAPGYGRIAAPFLTPIGSELLPLGVAALFVLTVSDWIGQSDRVVAAWSVFIGLHKLRGWFATAILGGFAYDVFKHSLSLIAKH